MGGIRTEPLDEPVLAELGEIRVGVEALGDGRVGGEVVVTELQPPVAARGHGQGVGRRLAVGAEAAPHLIAARHVEVGTVEAEALLVLAPGPGLKAEQDVVRLGVGRIDVVGIIGTDEGNAGPARDLQEPLPDRGLLGHPVVLDLQEVVVGSEDLQVLARHPLGQVQVAAQDGLGKLAADAPGEADQPLTVRGEQLLVDARLVVVALEVGDGGELDQVGVAGVVTGEQDQMVGVAVGATLLVAVGAGGHVDLAAQNWLDPGGDRRGVELDGAVEDAVIGDRHRRLAHRLCPGHQLGDARRTVQQRELAVDVEMDEGIRFSRRRLRLHHLRGVLASEHAYVSIRRRPVRQQGSPYSDRATVAAGPGPELGAPPEPSDALRPRPETGVPAGGGSAVRG